MRLPCEDAETSGRLSMVSTTSTISPHASPMCLPVSCVFCKNKKNKKVVHENDDPIGPRALQVPASTDATPTSTLTDFTLVNAETVMDILTNLNSYKSAGSDGLPPCMFKSCKTSIGAPLASIINQSLLLGVFPTAYRHAHVCPLFQSGDKLSATNCRPIISLLPLASKVLEKIVHRQVVEFFSGHNGLSTLPPEQFAYGSNHNCEDALALCIDRWNRALDDGQRCTIVFADMSIFVLLLFYIASQTGTHAQCYNDDGKGENIKNKISYPGLWGVKKTVSLGISP